jgi:hypothetical protein
MSIQEILEELPRLCAHDQVLVREKLDEIWAECIAESPEALAAIDAGIHSAETEPGHTVEQVRSEISSWISKSS